MSDEGSEKEVVQEIAELPGKKFFISHVNSYTGRVLLKELDNRKDVKDPEFAGHTFCGTLETGTNHIYLPEKGVPEGVDKVV